MTSKELVARLHTLVAAWNERDVDRIVTAFSPEALFRRAAGRGDGRGREAARADAEAVLSVIPDLELEIRRTLAVRSVITSEWTARGTSRIDRAAGATAVEWEGVLIADYDRAGQIREFVRHATRLPPGAPGRRRVERGPSRTGRLSS
jgi:hypothetical protein